MTDWEFCFLLRKMEMVSFVCLTLKGRGSWRLFIQPQDMGTYRTLSLPKELLVLFSFSACVGSVCLRFFTDSLLPALDICECLAHGCQLKEGSL